MRPMPQFIRLGNRWLNVDKIISVELNMATAQGDERFTVTYGCGANQTFVNLNPEESKKLAEWLQRHKVD